MGFFLQLLRSLVYLVSMRHGHCQNLTTWIQIEAVPIGRRWLRMVFHLMMTDQMRKRVERLRLMWIDQRASLKRKIRTRESV